MELKAAGNQWLKKHFGLTNYQLTHRSYIGTRNKIEVSLDGGVDEIFGPKYAADETITAHLEFALKYDDFNLDFLATVLGKTDQQEIIGYITANPTGRYARKIGFIYEWLTDKPLALPVKVGGNYVDFLDESMYITGNKIKNSRWRVNDNLLGTAAFCPIVRKTQAISESISTNFHEVIQTLKKEYSSEIFNRATQYLYRKETKSSYEIESENPSLDRISRFIALLHEAGKQPVKDIFNETNLTALQNAIVDPRYKQTGFRDFQNYIGQSNHRMEEIYHYVCPPPDIVHSMMEGLIAVEAKTIGNSPVIRAALIAFGFVFIHPFLDGNGRIHRFLIHDILTRDGFVDKDVIIPVSAHMVNNLKAYDAVLEAYSKPLMQRIQFVSAANGRIAVTNSEEVVSYFRYPDLTTQVIFLANAIRETIQHDLSDELHFLDRYDELKRAIQELIDMPDKKLNDLIVFIHQNKGKFPKRRKKYFPEISQSELEGIEGVYAIVFND